jgi:hypothetical protein
MSGRVRGEGVGGSIIVSRAPGSKIAKNLFQQGVGASVGFRAHTLVRVCGFELCARMEGFCRRG